MNWLRELRTKHGWTQGEIADKIGVSVSFVSDVERGERSLSAKRLAMLAEETGYQFSHLLFCQAVDQGEFILPMPACQQGRYAAARLLACWATMKEEEYQVIVDMAIERRGAV